MAPGSQFQQGKDKRHCTAHPWQVAECQWNNCQDSKPRLRVNVQTCFRTTARVHAQTGGICLPPSTPMEKILLDCHSSCPSNWNCTESTQRTLTIWNKNGKVLKTVKRSSWFWSEKERIEQPRCCFVTKNGVWRLHWGRHRHCDKRHRCARTPKSEHKPLLQKERQGTLLIKTF